jgi:hypothetical protein
VEHDDLKHLAYFPSRKTTTSENNDYEMFRNYVNEKPKLVPPPNVTHVQINLVDEDLGDVAITESKT